MALRTRNNSGRGWPFREDEKPSSHGDRKVQILPAEGRLNTPWFRENSCSAGGQAGRTKTRRSAPSSHWHARCPPSSSDRSSSAAPVQPESPRTPFRRPKSREGTDEKASLESVAG